MKTQATAMNTVETQEVTAKLRLAKKVLFEGFEIECYEDSARENGDFFMTRKQISECLNYENERSFHMVIERKKDKIGNPVVNKLCSTDGKHYDTELYSFEQLFEIIDGSRQPKADLFRKWAVRTLKELITGRAELTFKQESDKQDYDKFLQLINQAISPLQNKIIYLTDHIEKLSQKHKIFKNDKTIFSQLLTNFNAKIYDRGSLDGSAAYSRLYAAIENFTGIKIPSKKEAKLKGYDSIREYITAKLGIEFLEMFNNAILDERIVKNDSGNWVDLSGYKQNNFEFEKVKKEFDNCCAYCGTSESEDCLLIGEHIIPQSDINSSDRIHNILPSCNDCNDSKFNQRASTWYKEQPSYTDERFAKISKHWKKYFIK